MSAGTIILQVLQGTKTTVKNTLKARCFSEQEIQEILAGFEYAVLQEKYQKVLGRVINYLEENHLVPIILL